MSTITKQWLQQTIAEYEANRDELPFGLDDYQGNILAALRIALASLESEPSYFVNRVKHSDAYGEDVELRTYCYELDALKSKDDFGGEIVPVYTVPPAPFALPVQHWEELCRQNPDMSIGDAIIRAAWWNHCAAMLQGADGNSPVIPDDVRRMDWLVSKTVDVREPMVYGSHSLFWSQTITDEEDDYHATKLREQIDAAMAAEQAAAPHFREISNSSTKHFRENAETSTKCWCHTCRPVTNSDMRFVVCPDCGNKRCPHANDHRNACTGSNEPGQEGSAYPAAPQQEVKP